MAGRTLDDAAAAALWRLAHQPVEHMGLLYASEHGVQSTPTISSGQDAQVKGSLTVPAGSLLALFHNHPERDGRDRGTARTFSRDDKAQARRLGKPSYITTADRTVKRFDPATGDTEEVLAQIPVEEIRGYLMQKLLGRAPGDPRGLMR